MTAYTSKIPDATGLYPYTPEETAVWGELFSRQVENLQDFAAPAWFGGIEKLGLNPGDVPQVKDLDARLGALTGAGVTAVPAIIPYAEFADLLARRRFPVATFLRRREHMDYIEEPDLFHEVFGHTPMLTDPDFCAFLEGFGRIAQSIPRKDGARLFRLFWFTVEFGLMAIPQGLRAFGAGICSSPSETENARSGKVERLAFDPLTVLRTPYRIDIVQPVYFVIDNLAQLARAFEGDIPALVERSKALGDFDPAFDAAA